MIDKVCLLLIDFEGHPITGDEWINELRYSTLNSFIYALSTERCIILSNNHNGELSRFSPRMAEVERMNENGRQGLNGRHIPWITFDPDKDYDINDLRGMAYEKGYNIKKVIIGGTNTSGCVLTAKKYSAINWAKAGFDVIIWLPLCADYQISGLTNADKWINSFAEIYKEIKRENLMDKIDLLTWLPHEDDLLD